MPATHYNDLKIFFFNKILPSHIIVLQDSNMAATSWDGLVDLP